MSNIYQKIQERLGKRQATPAVGEAQAAADALRAKTGKATAPTGPRASNVAEQAAVDAARTGAQQQQQTGMALAQQVKDRAKALTQQRQVGEGALATEREVAQGAMRTQAQIGAQERTGAAQRARQEFTARENAQMREVSSKYDRLIKGLASNRRIQEQDILSTYRKGNMELAQRKDAHELWMIAQAKALSNDQYIQKLMQTGALNRLDDAGNFQSELQRTTLGEGVQMLIAQLGWEKAYNASAREFEEEIADMTATDAIKVAEMMQQAEIAEGFGSGGGKIMKELVK